jgi:hypothetical protein
MIELVDQVAYRATFGRFAVVVLRSQESGLAVSAYRRGNLKFETFETLAVAQLRRVFEQVSVRVFVHRVSSKS